MYFILYFNNCFLSLNLISCTQFLKRKILKPGEKGKVHFLVSKIDTELVLFHSDLGKHFIS